MVSMAVLMCHPKITFDVLQALLPVARVEADMICH
jgi:hypothetical protein